MNFLIKMKLNMKRKALIKAQEELKLLKLMAEKEMEHDAINRQINRYKEPKEEETSFIGREYPNYDEKPPTKNVQ